ncbi:unnamed protein product [Caenorhabditis brenneri]
MFLIRINQSEGIVVLITNVVFFSPLHFFHFTGWLKNFIGWPMGICILLTGIVAIVAILACIMFVICVKFATMADEEEAANKDSAKRVADEESVAYGAPVASNDIASQCDTDERAELIKVMLADENDI